MELFLLGVGWGGSGLRFSWSIPYSSCGLGTEQLMLQGFGNSKHMAVASRT